MRKIFCVAIDTVHFQFFPVLVQELRRAAPGTVCGPCAAFAGYVD